ncbi:MAG: hypothetical protein KJ826_05455 [Proteobacteria bacterium]|nr:hypothetical protein [Pseudomonadota bacterium]MBU4034985.1 hypothetical protein [Pseudomonadota bacterium]
MKRYPSCFVVLLCIVMMFAGCSSYKVKPLPFKAPASLNNAVNIAGADIAARAFTDPKETKETFGFDIFGAGMLPVQVVFDNQGSHALEVVGNQTFLEDKKGNLWPILSKDIAYERATRYAKTKEVFKEGAYKGFLGAAAGAVIGAAIGIVSGENVASAAGKGAAIGAAAGATIGGAIGYGSNDAIKSITNDLREKSLQTSAVLPKSLAHGILFFPGEAVSAKQLRLQIKETDTGEVHVIKLDL